MSFLALLLAPYAGTALVAVAGLRRTPPVDAPNEPPGEAVVVVAARNEAATILRCVEALAAQDHPHLHIVVADDGSSDGTGDLVRSFFGGAITVLGVPQNDASPLRGKARALAFATEYARRHHPHAALLFTDADCTPPPSWARAMAAALHAQPRPGVLGAAAFVRPRSAFAAAQTLDWALGAGVAAGLSAWGWTASAMGNNLAAAPDAYDAVGGFEGLPPSVTEDHALVRAVAERRFSAQFRIDPALTLDTEAAATFSGVLRQRQRWARGGLGGGWAVWALYGLVGAANLAFLAALATGAWAVAGAKIAADVAVLAAVQRRLGRRLPWAWLGLFEAMLAAYLLLVPAMLALPVVWKGRRF